MIQNYGIMFAVQSVNAPCNKLSPKNNVPKISCQIYLIPSAKPRRRKPSKNLPLQPFVK